MKFLRKHPSQSPTEYALTTALVLGLAGMAAVIAWDLLPAALHGVEWTISFLTRVAIESQ